MAHILVIDDEELVRRSINKMLTAEGHKVDEAETSSEGIAYAKAHQPDILITDILMPDKDGLEVIRELVGTCPDIQILAMTGGGSTGTLDFLPQAKAFGATATLHKPFLRQELLDAVEKLL